MQASTSRNTSVLARSRSRRRRTRSIGGAMPDKTVKSKTEPASNEKKSNGLRSPGSTSTPPILDDLDLMICHEEFTSLVVLVSKVKQVQKVLQSSKSASEYYYRNAREVPNSALAPCEVVAAVERMQEQLSVKNVVIRRGMYPLTDAMMDDNFSILQQEFDLLQSCLRESVKKVKGNEAMIASKYSKWQTDIFMHWVIDNKEDPFPDHVQAAQLAKATGLTISQVVNWMTNVRKRNRKATLDGKKKPHHFIDFLFLAQERDQSIPGRTRPASTTVTKQLVTAAAAAPRRRTNASTKSPKVSLSPPTTIHKTSATPFATTPQRHHHPFSKFAHPSSVPHTPASKRLPSPYQGWHRTVYSTPPSSSAWGVYNHDSRKRSRAFEEESPSASSGKRNCRKNNHSSTNVWEPHLKPVTETYCFDKSPIDLTLEPMTIDIDVDENILCVFAVNWMNRAEQDKDQDQQQATPPLTTSSSDFAMASNNNEEDESRDDDDDMDIEAKKPQPIKEEPRDGSNTKERRSTLKGKVLPTRVKGETGRDDA